MARSMERKPLLHPKALPPFAALRAFEAVGRLGGIRKAAESLNLDHAVVSRHIRSLEEWLGISLFHRSAGRVRLTDTGLHYHGRVSGAVVELASATASLLQRDDHRSLRVWCVPGLATQWVDYQISEFEGAHPDHHIELRPTDEPPDLMMHEADVDIRFYGDDWPPHAGGRGLKYVELARPPVMAVASPEFAERLGPLSSIADVLNATLLHEEHDEQWRAWFLRNGVTPPSRIPGPLLWHALLAVSAAKSGRGVALANIYLIEQDLKNGSLVELDLPGRPRPMLGAYAFVTREDRWALPIVSRFRRFLLSRADK